MKGATRVFAMPERLDLRAIMIGVIGGIASGMLGVGGGIVLVPALVFALRLKQREASVVSLAAIVPIATVGAVLFVGTGRVNGPIAGGLIIGSMLGAVAGARLLAHVPEVALRWLFAAIAAFTGVRMLLP